MSTAVEVLKCASCGSPLAPGAMECEYCGSKNLISSKPAQVKITNELVEKYIKHYADKAKEDPKDTNALYGMGLMYLQLKNYERAESDLKQAIDQSPMDSDIYYYYSLSLIAGKSIKTMSGADIERVEQYLGTAMNMQTKCKYLVLMAAIQEEYYQQNNLRLKGKGPVELFQEAKSYTPEELEEVTDHCAFSSSKTRKNIDILTGKAIAETSGIISNDAYLSVEQREAFFNNRLYPRKPHYGGGMFDLRSKESYIANVFSTLIALIPAIILSGVTLIIASCGDWGFKYKEQSLVAPKPLSSSLKMVAIDKQRAEAMKKNKKLKKFTVNERKDSILKLKKDSIKEITDFNKSKLEYSKMGLKNIKLYTSYSGGKEEALWLEKSATGYIWGAIVLAPIAACIIMLISKTIVTFKSNRSIGHHNDICYAKHRDDVEQYKSRPSPNQVMAFINKYLSELVENELKARGKNENDLLGKTLFMNEWTPDEDGSYEDREEGDFIASSHITYCIFLLEKNGVSFISNVWDITEDFKINSNLTTMPYSKISTVSCSSNVISFGGKDFAANYDMLWGYQSDDPSKPTFSNNSLSNVHLFAQALEKLATDRKIG